MAQNNEDTTESLTAPACLQPSLPESAAPMRDVENKVAIITGGDSGIGLGIARAFINAGMKVVITYRSVDHLAQAKDVLRDALDRVHAVSLDVTDRSAVMEAAEETIRVFGKIHVLINNAGVGPMVPLTNATFDDWDWCIGVNVNGVFNCIRAFLPRIRAHNDGGQIVSTSSMVGGLIAGPFWGVYSTSKFAVLGMMEALRSELSNANIGVSVYCPAGVSSNIGSSERNRPTVFPDAGVPDLATSGLIQKFGSAVQGIMGVGEPSHLMMDALEAGERVLRGIRNNDLYIITHPEFKEAIRDRAEALLASISTYDAEIPEIRTAFARIVRNPIYIQEVNKMRAEIAPR